MESLCGIDRASGFNTPQFSPQVVMAARLLIDGNTWCFKDKDTSPRGSKAFGATIRDAQTNFNREVGSRIKKPSLLGPEIQARYKLSDAEYEEMSPSEFYERHRIHQKIIEGEL